MELFFITFFIMALALAGMAIGVMFGRSPIAGSCGGLNNVNGECQSCSRPCSARKRALARSDADALEHPLVQSPSQVLHRSKEQHGEG